MKNALLVLVLVAVVALAVVAYAQYPAGQPDRPMMMGPAGPVAQPLMVYEGGSIFILRGDQLIKVQAATMTVEKTLMLPRPEMPKPVVPPGN